MMSIDQLITPQTADQVNEQFLSILETLQVPARSWRVGGVARTILKVVATTYANFTTLMASVAKSGFLETAEGDWLTLLALNVYGVTRREAAYANGTIRLVNAGGGVYSWLPGQVRVTWTTGKKDYVNTSAFSISGGQTVDVPFQASEAGASSSAAPGAIVDLQTSMLGVTVSNPAAFVGRDAESDPDLRQRCRDKLGTLSPNGVRGAYAYAVTSALRIDGSPVDINRVQISPSSSTGIVTIYVASPSGAPSLDDLGYVAENVEAIARPDTVTVNLFAASNVAAAQSITVWARRVDGVSATDIANLVNAALISEISTYPIGGIRKPPSTQAYLYGDFISGIVKSAHPSIFDIDGIGPDIPLNPGEVINMTTTIAVRIVEVS